MTGLTAFGLIAVTAMVVCYAFESRSHWFTLAFAGACVLGSVYGFLQGAWPFGMVEGVWAVIAVRRWWNVSPFRMKSLFHSPSPRTPRRDLTRD